MEFRFANERVLAIVAHPDDAELLCAGTLARARRDGATVGVCILCRGDKGQPADRVANLAAVRRREAAAAARLLDARLYHVGFGDGALFDGPAQRRKVVDVFRAFRPTLALAHAPEDYHPDHRAAAALAEAASWLAASHGQTSRRPPLDMPPALWWMDCLQATGFEAGFYINVSDFVELKRRMLACHRSQLARAADPGFASLEALAERQQALRGAEAGVSAAEAFRWHRAFRRLRAW